VIADHTQGLSTEATVKVLVGSERIVATAEGNGPVNALDGAVRRAIGSHYPALSGSTSSTTGCACWTRPGEPAR